ncbi:MAG: uncharacterized protein JWO94_834 [Verrucomicrobiaceae bacterium]|nr:uncharacterized protein [Verrucomicrobiaceae bacterium]
MKIATHIAGALLGLLFLAASVPYFLNLIPKMDPPPAGSYAALFLGAFAPSGYLSFVKAFELLGAILVAIPFTRNLGLLVLGPIIINILAFHVFIMKGEGLVSPMLMGLCLLALFLLWSGRQAFAGLMGRRS